MNKEKILIIEDDSIVALDIKRILNNLEYKVTNIVSNYEDAISSIKYEKPTLVFSDINLGKDKKDGIDIISEIQKNSYIPVIYLTAYSDEDTIQRAIKTNPLGYILKPFKKEDIKSTLLLALYKMKDEKFEKNISDIKLDEDYSYDLKNEILFYKVKPIKLSPKENQLLKILVEAKGRLVSFREIEYLLWQDFPVCDSTLRTLIYRLRTKLNYKIIKTIPSIGCKILNST
ncbi:response regulator [Aliarcobacter butzleri]|uniref:response regulator n=1 Tax=Aliarcobacter butzleri TaxID=28197 RepID=UPI00063ADE35|nr:response regulator [Aliarcobacter butzleri]KLE10694.1 regulator [Aliarcobacter butzleri L354]MBF7069967.1 DNA-binding response regulator [Aliarcobacter butzleri]MCG3653508.1 response regulator [Aliarcobacter butzleri]MCG3677692.1 response regulator [Aliarcobacter butzleri]MDN5071997.1 response regulator [Aliarcobacter butzleri]